MAIWFNITPTRGCFFVSGIALVNMDLLQILSRSSCCAIISCIFYLYRCRWRYEKALTDSKFKGFVNINLNHPLISTHFVHRFFNISKSKERVSTLSFNSSAGVFEPKQRQKSIHFKALKTPRNYVFFSQLLKSWDNRLIIISRNKLAIKGLIHFYWNMKILAKIIIFY